MKAGRLHEASPYIKKHHYLQSRDPDTGKSPHRLGCLLLVLFWLIAGAGPTVAQESTSRELDRVEIEAPETRQPQRARPRADTAQSRPPEIPDQTQRDRTSAPGDRDQRVIGSQRPAFSVVTEKSGLGTGSESLPSQVQVTTREDVARLNVRNYTDLFRKVPGVRAYAYGQGDIGHPIQIRGFAGGHGTDTAIYIDGVPQNFPSASQGGNGISDPSWLTPEMVDRIEIIKGPFSVLYGNFAQAGVINIVTKKSEVSPSFELSGGCFGNFRPVGVLSSEQVMPTPFLVQEYKRLDGYRDNSQYKHWSPFNKVTVPWWYGFLSLRFNYYTSRWGAPGSLGIDDVRQGIKDRRAAVNESDVGDQRRWGLVLNYTPFEPGGPGLHLTAYIENYVKNRFSTFPPSPQRLQDDDRIFYGGQIYYNFLFGNTLSLTVGGDTRYDRGSARRFVTDNQQIVSPVNDYHLGLLNYAWFVQAQLKPVERVKIVGGIRGDHFENHVDNRFNPPNSGIGRPSIVCPKVGFVLTPIDNINVFGNRGLGFKAPAASQTSPPSGTKNFALEPARTETWDLGINATLFNNVYLSADYYRTTMEKEIRTVAGEPVNVGDSERDGCEVEMRYYPAEQFTLFANYAWVDAMVTNPVNPGQDRVTGIAEHVIKAGIECTYQIASDISLSGDAYYEYLSGQPFYFGADPTPAYGPDYDAYNFKLTLEGSNWSVFSSATLQTREYSSDSISTTGNQFSFNPQPLWDVTAGVKYTY